MNNASVVIFYGIWTYTLRLIYYFCIIPLEVYRKLYFQKWLLCRSYKMKFWGEWRMGGNKIYGVMTVVMFFYFPMSRFICLLAILLSAVLPCMALVDDKGVEKHVEEANKYIYTEPVKAVAYANSAILKAERSGDTLQAAMAYIAMGRAYVNLGDFEQAFEAFYNAYDKSREGVNELRADVSVNLASLYRIFSDTQRAFDFVDRAIDIYAKLNDSAGIATCFNVRGLIFVKMSQNDSAEINFKKALVINRKLNRRKDITKNLNNLCLYEGNTEEKIEMLEEAIEINRELGATWSVCENFNNLGTQYFYAGKYQKALECLNKAMMYAKDLRAKELICDNYRYQSWVYTKLGDYKNAYNNLLLLVDTEKEMMSEKKVRKMENDVANHRFQEQQQRIYLKQNEMRVERIRNNAIIIALFLFSVIIFFVFLTTRSRHRKKILLMEAGQKLEAKEKEIMELRLNTTESECGEIRSELDVRKKELTNLACHIRSRNELFDKIKQEIKECYKDVSEEVKQQLKNVNLLITRYQDQENDLNILTKDIDRINTEFIVRLMELHPDLSPKEKQLASFLRINLSTKEIALLIGAVPKSVNMARYRLRKHLNLESDESLSEYIRSI